MQTIIYGAGASVPFFNPMLNTSYLTNKVSDLNEWDRVIQKYRHYNQSDQIPSASMVVRVIDAIRAIKPKAHFEQIAEILDKISSIGYDFLPVNNMMNLQWEVLKRIGFSNYNYDTCLGPGWRDIPFLLREIIAEAILELETSHKSSNYEELNKLQNDFIKAICEQSDQTSIVSFNYDDCVIDSLSGLGFKTGFKDTYSNYGFQLDLKTFMNAERVVYFPHGHVKFQFVDNQNVSFLTDSLEADEARWDTLDQMEVGSTMTNLPGRYAYNFNTFITTGQTKDDCFNSLPYSAYYQRLANDIAKSSIVYLIGYSFGDEHVNRLLQTFLKIKETNKVYIVDYYTNSISLLDEYKDDSNIITRIYHVFGTTWLLRYNSEHESEPFYKGKIDEINKRGFGELFDQVYFYKNGYDKFLHEFHKAIDLASV